MNREKITRVQMIKTSDIMKTDDLIYLEWLHNRLIDMYGENRNTDFVITLRRIINETEQKAVAIAPKQPRAKKKALRLFSVIKCALNENAGLIGWFGFIITWFLFWLIFSMFL